MKSGRRSGRSLAAELEVYFDPTLLAGFRSTINHLLQLMIFGIEVEEKISALSEALPGKIQEELTKAPRPHGVPRTLFQCRS